MTKSNSIIDSCLRRNDRKIDSCFRRNDMLTLKSYKVLFLACLLFLSTGIAASTEKGGMPGNFYTGFFVKDNVIALTFDDGPGTGSTERLLVILKENNVKATFFALGYFAKKYPAILKKVAEDGHSIGIHLNDHDNYYALSKKHPQTELEKKLADSIKKAEDAVVAATGKKPNLLRFPYGYCKKWALDLAGEKGYTVINWTFGADWVKMPVADFIKKMKKNSLPGAILLMHDGGSLKRETIGVVPDVIKNIRAKNLRFITIPEMLEMRNKQ